VTHTESLADKTAREPTPFHILERAWTFAPMEDYTINRLVQRPQTHLNRSKPWPLAIFPPKLWQEGYPL
jgi:hypothetical protein